MSPVARFLARSAVCLLGVASLTNAARAQLVESPLDSEEAAEEGVPFRGSSFAFSQSVTGGSFFRDTQLSYNPSYSWGFALDLVWHFDRTYQIALNQEIEVELTDSDSTTSQREPLLSDTIVTFDARVLKERYSPELTWTVHTSGSLIAPTSLASQASTMVLGTRLGVAANLSFPKVMSGAAVTGSVRYLHRWLTSNVVAVEEDYPCDAGPESLEMCGSFGGFTNTRNSLSAGVAFELALTDQWGLSLDYRHIWRRGANLSDDYDEPTLDGTRVVLNDGSRYHWRNVNTLGLSVSYNVLPWLGLGVSAMNEFSELGPGGRLRPPLKLAETYVGFDVSLRLDELYLATNGGDAAE